MADFAYSDIEQANALKLRIKDAKLALDALQSQGARSVISVALGPRSGEAIPSDIPGLVIEPLTDDPAEWPATLGLPTTLRVAVRDAIIAWLQALIAFDKTALEELSVDVTGAP